jgi:hypothetical protein
LENSKEKDSFEENEKYIYDEVQKEISSLRDNKIKWDKESEVLSRQKNKEEHQREVAHKILEKYNTNDNMGPETIPEEESVTDTSVLSPLNSSHKMDPSSLRNKMSSAENQEDFMLAPKFTKSEDHQDIRKDIFKDFQKSDLIQKEREEEMMKVHTFGEGKFSQLENVDVSLSESEEEEEETTQKEGGGSNFINSIQMKIQNLKDKFKANKSELVKSGVTNGYLEEDVVRPKIVKKEKEVKIKVKKKEKEKGLSEIELKKQRQRELRQRRMNYKPMLSRKSK